ncbi:MAG: hypothetical protein LC789_14490 [Actinobacteria bacterium]|nr:hypothetical protein [Actinomycetota bacterium]
MTARAAGRCACGHGVLLVKAGTVVRVAVGTGPVTVSMELDRLERVVALCPSCGASCGPARPFWAAEPPADGAADETALAAAREAAFRLIAQGEQVSYAMPSGAGAAAPEPVLCDCGCRRGCAVFYGDAYLRFDDGVLTGRVLAAAGAAADPTRWECVGMSPGCGTARERTAAARAEAAARAAGALAGTPDMQLGAAGLPARGRAGWPGAAVRVRSRPAPPAPAGGWRHPLEGLERGTGDARDVPYSRVVAYLEAGFVPDQLVLRHPEHVVEVRRGRARPRCGGWRYGMWLETALPADEAAMWAREGFSPCCARRFSLERLHPRLDLHRLRSRRRRARPAVAGRGPGARRRAGVVVDLERPQPPEQQAGLHPRARG